MSDHMERLKAALDGRQRVRHALGESHPGMALVDVPDLEALLAEVEQLRTARVPLMVLRQAWRNGWTDRANAFRQAVADSNGERDAYERAFVRYMSEDPAEDDKDPYRPLDGPDDPALERQVQGGATCGFPSRVHPGYQHKQDGGAR